MHYKILSIILAAVIVIITFAGLNSDTRVKKIQIRNRNFEITNENANIANRDVEISLDGTNVKNKDISYNNKGSLTQTTANIDNTSFKVNTAEINPSDAKFNNKNPRSQKLKQPQKSRYTYENISWNEWKSDFINQILDDLEYIPSLNDYGLGSWFYYSFDVMADGSIRNIKIFSLYLNNQDRLEIINLIKSYKDTEITKFPTNSKRIRAKVDAVVILSTEETKSSPSDFNDRERVKIKY